MEIKFKKALSDYRYLIMFDLASRISGVCIWDLEKHKPITTRVLQVKGKEELPAAELYNLIDQFFTSLGIETKCILVSKEQGLLNAGKFSTVQTITALARAHTVLDLYCFQHNIDCYDYTGVAPATTHAYFKAIQGLDSKAPVDKEMVREYLYSQYSNLKDLSLDESDSVFLAKTLVESKWNKDINEEIKAVKRHSKELKSEHGKNTCLEEIKRLESLKITI